MKRNWASALHFAVALPLPFALDLLEADHLRLTTKHAAELAPD